MIEAILLLQNVPRVFYEASREKRFCCYKTMIKWRTTLNDRVWSSVSLASLTLTCLVAFPSASKRLPLTLQLAFSSCLVCCWTAHTGICAGSKAGDISRLPGTYTRVCSARKQKRLWVGGSLKMGSWAQTPPLYTPPTCSYAQGVLHNMSCCVSKCFKTASTHAAAGFFFLLSVLLDCTHRHLCRIQGWRWAQP